jgi:hypothetical protein
LSDSNTSTLGVDASLAGSANTFLRRIEPMLAGSRPSLAKRQEQRTVAAPQIENGSGESCNRGRKPRCVSVLSRGLSSLAGRVIVETISGVEQLGRCVTRSSNETAVDTGLLVEW